MTKKPFGLRNENLPAFPTEFSYGDHDFTGMPIISHSKYPGITKREYFLARAFSGFMAKHGAVDFTHEDIKRINKAVDMMLGIEAEPERSVATKLLNEQNAGKQTEAGNKTI